MFVHKPIMYIFIAYYKGMVVTKSLGNGEKYSIGSLGDSLMTQLHCDKYTICIKWENLINHTNKISQINSQNHIFFHD